MPDMLYPNEHEYKVNDLEKDVAFTRSYLSKRRKEICSGGLILSSIIGNLTGSYEKCESEAELAFAKTLGFYLKEGFQQIEMQVWMPCGSRTYRADFKVDDSVFEVDGRDFHQMEYDKPRDLAIVKHGHAKRVYRIPARTALYFPLEWLLRVSEKHPSYFNEKALNECKTHSRQLRDFEALISYT